jgi:histidinol dehydrogenase
MDLPILIHPRDRSAIHARLTREASAFDPKTEEEVRKIIARVRKDGDKALIHFSRKYDTHPVMFPKAMALHEDMLAQAWEQQSPELQMALRRARARITRFHENQRTRGFRLTEPNGNRLTQQVFPLRSVGIYVPGGTASYPSTVLMNVIPAQVAGVTEIVMVTPPSPPTAGQEATLAAAHLCGIKTVHLAGGAQAIAALAFGTETIARVDKVVGPGNRWVATAKRLLFGQIDIDSVAGATDVLIIADDSANPEHVAADLLAQAEHDPDAEAIVIVVGGKVIADKIRKSLETQTKMAMRRDIMLKSLKSHAAIICVKSINDAVELANLRAPEHCQVMTQGARAVAERIRDAGAVFVGHWTPEAMGDYVAGPNHVLPTGRTARFSSPLGVESFIRRNQVIECTRDGFLALADTVRTLSTAEGFEAHRNSVEIRMGEIPAAGESAAKRRTAKPSPKAPKKKPARAAAKASSRSASKPISKASSKASARKSEMTKPKAKSSSKRSR